MELKPGYKLTEAGVIPEDWDSEKLGNFIVLQRGHDLTWRDRRHGEIPVMGSAGHNGFHNVAIASSPGVVLGRSGASFGQAHYCEQDFWPHNTALYVTDFRGNDPLFVFYFLTAFDFSRHNSGGAQQSLNRNFIAPLPIGVPPPSEQRSIATALSDMDELLGALDRLIAKKRDLKQAAMQQLLMGKIRLPGFGEGKGYKTTDIGVVPEDWVVGELGALGTFKNGINKNSEDFGFGFPFVNLMDIFGVSSISENQHLGLVNSNDIEKKVYDLKEGDVIFVRSSVKPSGVGLTTVVKKDLTDTVYSGFLIRFRDAGYLDANFKEYCFSEESFRQRVIASSTVSANTNINQDNLKKLIFAYPKLREEQHAIATILSDMDAEITTLEQRRDKTRALKQAMMQELLTGRIRLV